jgi:hypothetical protein
MRALFSGNIVVWLIKTKEIADFGLTMCGKVWLPGTFALCYLILPKIVYYEF